MAILNFPDTTGQPTDGTFTYEFEGITYTWDGEKWIAQGGGSIPDITNFDFVKLDDEGTEQAITGGGGLNIEFGTDAEQLGNIAPLNDWSVYPARS